MLKVIKGAPQVDMVGNRLLIKEFQPEAKTSSGLYIPDEAKNIPWKGVVVAAGDGETAANLAREVIASSNKEIELTRQALQIGDQQGFVNAATAQANAAADAAEECRKVELSSVGLVAKMKCQVGDVVMYQSGIWANSMKVSLDGYGEFLIIREDYIALIRHKAGSSEALAEAALLGLEFSPA